MISLCAFWSLTKYFLINSVDVLLSLIKKTIIIIGIFLISIIGAVVPVIPLIIIFYIIDKHNDSDNDKILTKKFLIPLSIIEIITFCVIYWFDPIKTLVDFQFYTIMLDSACAIYMLMLYLVFPTIKSAYNDLREKYKIFYKQCENKS